MRPRRTRRKGVAGTAGVLAVGFLVSRWIALASRRIDFRGRHVLITNGTRGLGLAIAREFAAEGARLTICARDAAEVEQARQELAHLGAQVQAFVADMRNAAQVRRLVRDATTSAGPVDVLVNHAGVVDVGSYDAMTVPDYDRAMRVHFWGPLYAIQAVVPAMRARQSGRIVNIASIGGKVSVPNLLPYSASKFAFVGLSEGLRTELARDNVLVTTVCPGLVRSGVRRRRSGIGQRAPSYAIPTASSSMSSRSVAVAQAARRIVDACRFGESEVIVGAAARAAAWVHGLCPGLTSEALGALTRLLPTHGEEATYGRRQISSVPLV